MTKDEIFFSTRLLLYRVRTNKDGFNSRPSRFPFLKTIRNYQEVKSYNLTARITHELGIGILTVLLSNKIIWEVHGLLKNQSLVNQGYFGMAVLVSNIFRINWRKRRTKEKTIHPCHTWNLSSLRSRSPKNKFLNSSGILILKEKDFCWVKDTVFIDKIRKIRWLATFWELSCRFLLTSMTLLL